MVFAKSFAKQLSDIDNYAIDEIYYIKMGGGVNEIPIARRKK